MDILMKKQDIYQTMIINLCVGWTKMVILFKNCLNMIVCANKGKKVLFHHISSTNNDIKI